MKRLLVISLIALLTNSAWSRIPDLTFVGVDSRVSEKMKAYRPLSFRCISDDVAIQMFEFGIDPGRRNAVDWSVTLTSETDTLTVKVKSDPGGINTTDDPFVSHYSIYRNNEKIDDIDLRASRGTDRQPEFIRVVSSPNEVVVYGGRGSVSTLRHLPSEDFYSNVDVCSNTNGTLVKKSILYKPAIPTPRMIFETEDEMHLVMSASTDSNICFWTFYDEDYDDEIASLAAKYRLFLLSDNLGGYYILYVDGIKRDSIWQTGMLKGHIIPTTIEGSYNLEWYDNDGRLMNENISATLENGVLALNFPFEKARFRFIRERP